MTPEAQIIFVTSVVLILAGIAIFLFAVFGGRKR